MPNRKYELLPTGYVWKIKRYTVSCLINCQVKDSLANWYIYGNHVRHRVMRMASLYLSRAILVNKTSLSITPSIDNLFKIVQIVTTGDMFQKTYIIKFELKYVTFIRQKRLQIPSAKREAFWLGLGMLQINLRCSDQSFVAPRHKRTCSVGNLHKKYSWGQLYYCCL